VQKRFANILCTSKELFEVLRMSVTGKQTRSEAGKRRLRLRNRAKAKSRQYSNVI
jgi:hypothetical protein